MRRLIPLLWCAACAHSREPAPEDVDGLSRWIFQNHDDPEALREGTGNLAVWLSAEGRSADDGYVLSDFSPEEVADVPHPDRALDLLVGVAVPGVSPFDIAPHAALIAREDQLFNDPGTYARYVRTVVDGDLAAFLDGQGTIRTVNDIDKKGAFGVNIPYTLFKDFTWVDLGDAGRAVVARSWTEDVACAEGGNNCLNQSFSLDFWYEPAPGETIRMTDSWAELVTEADAFLNDDQRVALMVSGVHDIFENTDEALAEGL